MRSVVIVGLAWLVGRLVHRAIGGFRNRVAGRLGGDLEAVKRAETISRVSRYLVTVVVALLGGMLVLGEIGISVAPILGAAGVVGLAVGFGAQSLVKDFFTGFFLLLENQIREGDVIRIDSNHAGLVEVLTLRYVQLRDYDGNVHFVPNSQISTVVNMSRGFAQAVMDIGVAYRENVDEVMAVMQRVGDEMRDDPLHGPRILDRLEMAGVDRWADSAVIIRCRFRVRPLEQWTVRREYLRRLKSAFDAAGIEIPYPHLTIYAGRDRLGEAPTFPLELTRSRPVEAPPAAAS